MKQGKSSTSKGVSTKRQAIREKRQQRERQQRLYILLGIVAVAIVIAAILFIPNLIPAGDFVQITPVSRPMVDGRSLGDPNAPVKIEVYEDFQCPACRSYSSDIEPQLIDNYVATGQVYYTYRHFPFHWMITPYAKNPISQQMPACVQPLKIGFGIITIFFLQIGMVRTRVLFPINALLLSRKPLA